MDAKTNKNTPLVSFYRFIPSGRPPMRADNAACGTMPTRAFRFCEAIRMASAFGWYVFPPIRFSLMWDGGTDVSWTYEGADNWYPLKTAQFPDFAGYFDGAVPEPIKGFSPPFLAALKEPGLVQIWSGLVARTAPGWSLLIRPPANLARSLAYDSFEGIIETDSWFGPLFTNIRLTRTNAPVEFDPEFPFLQVQPVQQNLYEGQALDTFDMIPDLAHLNAEEWDAFHATVVRPNIDPDRQRGQYAVKTRRRRKRVPSDTE